MMITVKRRKLAVFFLVFGICLIAFAIALNVGWIFLSLEQLALLVFGIVFFALIITGLTLNTIFLLREMRRNEQQDALINAVTHELKTPVASIRLYLETLKTRNVGEAKQHEFYEIMLNDTERLHTTIDLILQAGRAREKFRLNPSQFSLNQTIEESIRRIRNRYDLPENLITFAAEEDFKMTGDASQMQSVFLNLIDNAVKYSDEQAVEITVKEIRQNTVEVSIKDSGIGIPPNELKRIFKRFYRVENSTTQKRKGTGLGLFIVQSAIKKHGGKIWAESAGLGSGTRFVIQLPQDLDD